MCVLLPQIRIAVVNREARLVKNDILKIVAVDARSSPMRIHDVYLELANECEELRAGPQAPLQSFPWMAVTECAKLRRNGKSICYGQDRIFASERQKAKARGKSPLCNDCVAKICRR